MRAQIKYLIGNRIYGLSPSKVNLLNKIHKTGTEDYKNWIITNGMYLGQVEIINY